MSQQPVNNSKNDQPLERSQGESAENMVPDYRPNEGDVRQFHQFLSQKSGAGDGKRVTQPEEQAGDFADLSDAIASPIRPISPRPMPEGAFLGNAQKETRKYSSWESLFLHSVEEKRERITLITTAELKPNVTFTESVGAEKSQPVAPREILTDEHPEVMADRQIKTNPDDPTREEKSIGNGETRSEQPVAPREILADKHPEVMADGQIKTNPDDLTREEKSIGNGETRSERPEESSEKISEADRNDGIAQSGALTGGFFQPQSLSQNLSTITATPAQTASYIQNVAQYMIDQMLVNDAALNQNQEVRIQLRPNMLAGSEIQITREGGTLRINFIPPHHEMAEFIQKNLQGLRNQLMERFDFQRIDLQVTQQGQGTSQENNEGRSRQQRNLQQEMEEQQQQEEEQ